MPSSSLIHVLEGLTELRETIIHVYQVIIKDGINNTDEQVDEGMHRTSYVRRGEEPPCSLGAIASPNFCIFTNLQVL